MGLYRSLRRSDPDFLKNYKLKTTLNTIFVLVFQKKVLFFSKNYLKTLFPAF